MGRRLELVNIQHTVQYAYADQHADLAQHVWAVLNGDFTISGRTENW